VVYEFRKKSIASATNTKRLTFSTCTPRADVNFESKIDVRSDRSL